ncbi:unnamed protein product, partial [Urochloa humidicola]
RARRTLPRPSDGGRPRVSARTPRINSRPSTPNPRAPPLKARASTLSPQSSRRRGLPLFSHTEHVFVEPAPHRAEPSRHHHATAPPLPFLRPAGSSEDPEDPDYFDDVDYAEEKDKANTPVCELQVRTCSTSPNA